MKLTENIKTNLPQDLIKCIDFHGHLCPGLVYGYLVAKEAISLLELKRSNDEEIIAISENDSCAVDALQVLLGATAGKGNLIFKNYGKNAYTIIRRSNKKMFRFCRKKYYYYDGKFVSLYAAINSGSASKEEQSRYKILKGYVRVKCGISKVSVFSIGYQYSKILLKVIHINCSKDLIIFFHN